MTRRYAYRKTIGALLMTLMISSAWPATGLAQESAVRLQGRVSWVAGETLVMSTDETPSIRIDLSQVDQADYQRLASGDRVIVTGIIVTGTIPDDRDRIVATSIVSLSP
jgi:hypothetical protein